MGVISCRGDDASGRRQEGGKSSATHNACNSGVFGKDFSSYEVWLNSWPDFPVQVHNPRQENGDGPQGRGCEGEEGRTTPMTCTDDQMRDVPSLCFCSLISKWSACGTSKIPPGEGFSLSPIKGREGWFPVPGERVLGSTSHVCQDHRDGSQFLGKEFYDPLVMSARDTEIRE